MTEDFVIKYFWSAIGYGLMSIPIFYPTIGKAIPGAGLGEHDQVAARAEGKLSPLSTPIQLMVRIRLQQALVTLPGRCGGQTDVLW